MVIQLVSALVILLGLAAVTLYYFYCALVIKNLGNLPISTASCAFNHEQYGKFITWDKHTFYLHGKPFPILAGEFHYWRLPDQSRWKSILLTYKSAGLNCIRIYFHWGYHSPSEGVYHFDGNRDVEYLLNLCEELQLFVLCAPGPYICAETQAGGHPIWLVAKRNVRIRHLVHTFYRSFDLEYSKYGKEWFSAILPILKRHQITEKKNGCVLALQIENENFEKLKSIPIGLMDDMRYLCKLSRDLGMTVPFFTNDAWESGSFVTKHESYREFGKEHFGVDLYGFDKYVVFCPNSSPMAALVSSGPTDTTKWGEWSAKDVANSFGDTEELVRSFGGGASESPIFIPELQGGWFNHYTVGCTYDDIYNYFGEMFTKMIVETAFSQGSTAFSIYMFYGGTNWGTLGDPDVYTSYDYSACIREYGLLSGRGRLVRLAFHFIQSFWPELNKTEPSSKIRRIFNVSSTTDNFISKERRHVNVFGPVFVFFRNFSTKKKQSSTITVSRHGKEPVSLKCQLPYKHSFIGLGNYCAKNGLKLLISTFPIHVRYYNSIGEEVWIIQYDDETHGQLAFVGDITISGSLKPNTIKQDDVTVVSFRATRGSAKISPPDSNSNLWIIALSIQELKTMAVFRDDFWVHNSGQPTILWGSNNFLYDPSAEKHISVAQAVEDTQIYCISPKNMAGSLKKDSTFEDVPEIYSQTLPPYKPQAEIYSQITFTEHKEINFDTLPWIRMDLNKKGEPLLDILDYGYTSGTVVYKLNFEIDSLPKGTQKLRVNLRHFGTIYLNGTVIGEQITYSLGVYRPGGKSGPDFGTKYGWQSFQVSSQKFVSGLNEIVVVVENLGINRTPGPINDVRNGRGLLGLQLEKTRFEWYISGVDVRRLHEVFNHSGFANDGQDFLPLIPATNEIPKIVTKPTWFRGTFTASLKTKIQIPLCLHIEGKNTAHVFVNGIFVARYFGVGPQNDFYVPDGLVKEQNKIEVVTWGADLDHTVSLKLGPWMVDGLLKSGNVDQNGVPVALRHCPVQDLSILSS